MLAIRLGKLLKEQEEQIKNRDESLEKAREEIKWLRGMLKERETNPIEPVEGTVNDVLLWHCGKCGFYLGPNDNFCSNCGRSVKWNEID